MRHINYSSLPVSFRRKSGTQICAAFAYLVIAFITSDAFAQCVSTLEPNLKNESVGGIAGAGVDIINAIFAAINSIMTNMAQIFYTGIVTNPNYITSVNALVLLYITVYGIMIMLNLASHKTGEVVTRLFKIAVVWSIMTSGWTFFSYWVGDPLIKTLNDLITQFSQAGGGGNVNAVDAATGQLSAISMQMLFGSMTLMFSLRLVVALLALFSTGAFGWFFALCIIWALVEFIFMLIGAIITYVKSIVGLAFLFALAPIFFTFILFEKSKQVFVGWLNQVLGFFLQPVLLFAFLGFYATILTDTLTNVLFPPGLTDYCWVKFFGLGIFDVDWWRGINGANDMNGGDWHGPPPVDILDVLYFLLLTHLGKNLSKFIEQISQDISGGSGAGITRGDTVGKWMSNNIPGMKGRGVGALAADFGKGAFNGAKSIVSHRKEIGAGIKKTAENVGGVIKNVGGKVGSGAEKVAKVGVRTAMHPVQSGKEALSAAGQAKDKVVSATGQALSNVGQAKDRALTATRQAANAAIQAPGKGLAVANQVRKDLPQNIDRGIKALGEAKGKVGEAIKNDIHVRLDATGKAFGDMGKAFQNVGGEVGQKVRDASAVAQQAYGAAAHAVLNPGETTGNIVNAAFHAGNVALHAAGGGLGAAGQAVGHGIATGAGAVGHGIATGAGAVGHGIATGAGVVVHSPIDAYNVAKGAVGNAAGAISEVPRQLDNWSGWTETHSPKKT